MQKKQHPSAAQSTADSSAGSVEMRIIARIRSDFPTKFGIPRQSGLVESLQATVVFEPPYRNPDALRGLSGYSHLWLIWQFSESVRQGWSPTVRPPRLGGNRRMGVFATRSPFRPNAIGLSCVKIANIEPDSPVGPVIHILGADLMDGTPILDLKPYLPHADCKPEATGGFSTPLVDHALKVECPPELLLKLPEQHRQTLLDLLAQDPRPSYQHDPNRVYGFPFAGFEIRFSVQNEVLLVREIIPEPSK